MPDETDKIQELGLLENEGLITEARRKADIPAGEPGDCTECGEPSKRLVGGRCAPCRDGRNG